MTININKSLDVINNLNNYIILGSLQEVTISDFCETNPEFPCGFYHFLRDPFFLVSFLFPPGVVGEVLG